MTVGYLLAGDDVKVRFGQLGLELLVEQLVAVLAQEHEQLRPPHRLDHRLLRRRRLNRRLPHPGPHHKLLPTRSRIITIR
jgi:hypothetical protein